MLNTPYFAALSDRLLVLRQPGRQKNVGIVPKECHRFQIVCTFICIPMYSAWRIARVTMVSVGFSAAPVVN